MTAFATATPPTLLLSSATFPAASAISGAATHVTIATFDRDRMVRSITGRCGCTHADDADDNLPAPISAVFDAHLGVTLMREAREVLGRGANVDRRITQGNRIYRVWMRPLVDVAPTAGLAGDPQPSALPARPAKAADLISTPSAEDRPVIVGGILEVALHDHEPASSGLIFDSESDHLRQLIESAEDLILVHDREGRYTYYNGPTRYGLTREQVVGRMPEDFFAPDQAAAIHALLQRVLQSGQTSTDEIGLEWQGEWLSFLDLAFPLRNAAGEVVSVARISRNITSLKKAQHDLARDRAFLDALLQTLPVAVSWRDRDLALAGCNHRCREFRGCGPKPHESGERDRFRRETASPDHGAEVDARVLRDGEPATNLEEVVTDDRGRERVLLTNKIPLRNERGEISGVISVSQDITHLKSIESELRRHRDQLDVIVRDRTFELTQALQRMQVEVEERRRVEHVLREREAQLQLVADVTPTAIAVVDCVTGAVSFVNPALRSMFRLKSDAPEAPLMLDDLLPPAVAQDLLDRMQEEGAASHETEFRFVTGGDEAVRWIAALATPIAQESRPAMLLSLTDRTRQRAAEREGRARQAQLHREWQVSAIGEFVANLAHELQQPLTALLNHAVAAQHRLATPSEAERVRVAAILGLMQREIERSVSIIRRLRDLMQQHPLSLQPRAMDVVVRESVDYLRDELDAASLSVDIQCEPDLPNVRIDAILMQQVMINILRNSISAVAALRGQDFPLAADERMGNAPAETADPAPTPDISISLFRQSSGSRGAVQCEIRDYGPGVSPDALQRIFDPFTTTRQGGLGMGLAICRRIVERHLGSIGARIPEDGPGLIVWIALPFNS